jgi:hypothetical protein
MHKWKPPGKRNRGRPNKSWLEGIVTTMKNRGLTFEDAQDGNGKAALCCITRTIYILGTVLHIMFTVHSKYRFKKCLFCLIRLLVRCIAHLANVVNLSKML